MISFFKFIALAEGVSYLLFALTMPMKYVWQMPQPNYYVGMLHGLLFILYCVMALVLANTEKWGFKKTVIIGGASLVPFGTFVVVKRYFTEAKS